MVPSRLTGCTTVEPSSSGRAQPSWPPRDLYRKTPFLQPERAREARRVRASGAASGEGGRDGPTKRRELASAPRPGELFGPSPGSGRVPSTGGEGREPTPPRVSPAGGQSKRPTLVMFGASGGNGSAARAAGFADRLTHEESDRGNVCSLALGTGRRARSLRGPPRHGRRLGMGGGYSPPSCDRPRDTPRAPPPGPRPLPDGGRGGVRDALGEGVRNARSARS